MCSIVIDTEPQYEYLLEGFVGESEVEMVMGDFCRSKESLEKRRKQIEEDLTNMIPSAVKDSIPVKVISVEGSPVHHVIVEKATEWGVDIIVIATHGRTGLAHVLLGSVAEHVARFAPCPVFVIRNPTDKFFYGWDDYLHHILRKRSTLGKRM